MFFTFSSNLTTPFKTVTISRWFNSQVPPVPPISLLFTDKEVFTTPTYLDGDETPSFFYEKNINIEGRTEVLGKLSRGVDCGTVPEKGTTTFIYVDSLHFGEWNSPKNLFRCRNTVFIVIPFWITSRIVPKMMNLTPTSELGVLTTKTVPTANRQIVTDSVRLVPREPYKTIFYLCHCVFREVLYFGIKDTDFYFIF